MKKGKTNTERIERQSINLIAEQIVKLKLRQCKMFMTPLIANNGSLFMGSSGVQTRLVKYTLGVLDTNALMVTFSIRARRDLSRTF